MNRINPLYIGLLLVVVLLISVVQLNSSKGKLQEAKLSYKNISKLADNLVSLKKAYANKTKMEKSLRSLLRNKSLQASKMKATFKKSSVKLSSKSIDKNALNYLMGKLVNGSYHISSFEIKKLSEEKASFKMEIKW